jgi:hypothetical protein
MRTSRPSAIIDRDMLWPLLITTLAKVFNTIFTGLHHWHVVFCHGTMHLALKHTQMLQLFPSPVQVLERCKWLVDGIYKRKLVEALWLFGAGASGIDKTAFCQLSLGSISYPCSPNALHRACMLHIAVHVRLALNPLPSVCAMYFDLHACLLIKWVMRVVPCPALPVRRDEAQDSLFHLSLALFVFRSFVQSKHDLTFPTILFARAPAQHVSTIDVKFAEKVVTVRHGW